MCCGPEKQFCLCQGHRPSVCGEVDCANLTAPLGVGCARLTCPDPIRELDANER